MKRIVLLLTCFSILMPVVALDVEVEYVDGYLDIRDGSQWIELVPGDPLTDDDTIKLDTDSLATLSYPGGTFTLTRPGVYPVANLIRSRSNSRSVGTLVTRKLKRLVAEPERTRSAVGGVRGAKQDDEVEWMSSEAEELISSGKKYLAEDSIEQALEAFIEAYDYAEIEEEPEILYYTGYAHYVLGNIAEALESVDAVEVDDGAYFAPDFYILKGQILTDSFAFEDAVSWLESVPEKVIEDDTATFQAVNLLLANCMISLGDNSAASTYLDRVIKADPGSPYAAAAREAQ